MTSSVSTTKTTRNLFDAVPAHEAGRRPVGRHRLHQPAPGIFGGERDALRLPRFYRQRIQPEWLPPVVEPVQQPEMMPMEVEYFRGIGAICQGQPHRAAGLGAERGRSRRRKVSGRDPMGLWSPERQINPRRVLEVELGWQAIGWQRRGRRQRGVPERGLIGGDQPRDGASLPAIVKEYRCGRARRRRRIDESIDPGSWREYQRAGAREKRLRRPAAAGAPPAQRGPPPLI